MTHNQNAMRRPILPVVAGMAVLSVLMVACATASSGQPTPADLGPALASVINKPVVIIDNSGQVLGDGKVNLYAPSSMALDDVAKIRLEISGVGAVVNAPEAATAPAGQSTQPSASETLSIHEIMGATLQGVDTAHFTINTVPPNGLRNVDPKAVTWWEWNLRPAGPQAAGMNALEVFVYYPRTDSNGNSLNQEIATFPVSLQVIGPPTPTPTPAPGVIEQLNKNLGPVAGIAGAITAIAGAIGVLYGAFRFFTRHSRRRRKSTK